MFSSRKANNLIKKTTAKKKKKKKENREITLPWRNSQVLMTKVYKTINGHAPSIMDILLIFSKNTHNLKFFQIIFKKKQRKK